MISTNINIALQIANGPQCRRPWDGGTSASPRSASSLHRPVVSFSSRWRPAVTSLLSYGRRVTTSGPHQHLTAGKTLWNICFWKDRNSRHILHVKLLRSIRIYFLKGLITLDELFLYLWFLFKPQGWTLTCSRSGRTGPLVGSRCMRWGTSRAP